MDRIGSFRVLATFFFGSFVAVCSMAETMLAEREWTNHEGQTFRGKMVGFRSVAGSEYVSVQRGDGRTFEIALPVLSREDQAYAREKGAPLSLLDEPALAGWWQSHTSPETWPEEVARIEQHLAAFYQLTGISSLEENSPLFDWFYHLQWLELHRSDMDGDTLSAFIEIGSNPRLRNTFLDQLHPEDHAAKALRIYLDLYQANRERFSKYRDLAAAFAVVFDQPFPRNWPHHQVPQSVVPFGDEEPLVRFNHYVQANEDQLLEYDLSTLPAHLLKFVVDSKIRLSEFAWARGETKFNLRKLDDAFGYISYDYQRVSGQSSVYGEGRKGSDAKYKDPQSRLSFQGASRTPDRRP